MDREDLLSLLKAHEWNDIEFKRATHNVPSAAYETVSAFVNTSGGWLIFGVDQQGGAYRVEGVTEVDKVQNEFLSTLHSGQKLNGPISPKAYLLDVEGKTVLAFHIPEARRQDKPVYLNGAIRRSFIRRGGCDQKCNEGEIKCFLRDASQETFDCETVDLDPEHCFDPNSIAEFRRMFYERHPEVDQSVSHLEFLDEFGLVVEQGGKLWPTKAALLLFGGSPDLARILPRPIVDCQWVNADSSDELPDQRWIDRVVSERNLMQTWRSIIDGYLRRSDIPFSVRMDTLQRNDLPPDYVTFRESVVNLLIHQDYGDSQRKAVVKFFRDRTIFWNPGNAFATSEQLLEPGEKELRNPRVVTAFRRIGLSEQAGTGIRRIYGNWHRLGLVPPVINNDKAGKSFELTLLKEPLLSEEQILFQANLGVRLSDDEAATFALACRSPRSTLLDVRVKLSLSNAEAEAVLQRLVTQFLLEKIDEIPHPYYVLAKHLRGRPDLEREETDGPQSSPHRLVSDQPWPLTHLSETQWQILMFCDLPRSMAAIMGRLGVTHRAFFRRTHLDPLLRGNIVRMTHPEQPNHPQQAYVLTEAGVELKALHLAEQVSESSGTTND